MLHRLSRALAVTPEEASAAGAVAVAHRLRAMRLVVAAAISVLGVRLWFIQSIRADELTARARANRYVTREIEADRGVIYDASGRQLVFNTPRFSASLVPGALGELAPEARERVLRHLADVLGRPLRSRSASLRVGRIGPRDASAMAQDEELAATFGTTRSIESYLPRDRTGRPMFAGWNAVAIDRNVTRETAFELIEGASDLPGVVIDEPSVRGYPAGPTLAHLLGFTGSIPEEDLGGYLADGYRIYDIVGRSGVEATYETFLRGEKGKKVVMVDASGREVEPPAGDDLARITQAPVAGSSLHLTLDLGFQEAVESALARGLSSVGARAGAVAVIDPRDGAVRALVTLPHYDNNLFSAGASPEEFINLLTDSARPLVNRAISGQPPGSTFKIITASAALQEGVIDTATRINDPGMIVLPNEYNPKIVYPFVCWNRGGHGSLNVIQALAHSCDVFFYEVSGGYFEHGASQQGLGSERLARYARAFGLGQRTEVELLGEADGLVPTPAWLTEFSGEYWGTGQTYYMGIGQGYTLASPLQMANATAAVANGGTLFRPHLVQRIGDGGRALVAGSPRPGAPGGVLAQVPVAPEFLAAVREGMRGVTTYGTALPSWSHLPTEVSVAGKTGTAEFCDYVPEIGDCRKDREGHYLTHAWFVGFAPYEAPEVALAVFVDGSGLDHVIEGSQLAAPIAGDVLRAYFGLPERALPEPPCEGDDCPEPSDGASPAREPISGAPEREGAFAIPPPSLAPADGAP